MWLFLYKRNSKILHALKASQIVMGGRAEAVSTGLLYSSSYLTNSFLSLLSFLLLCPYFTIHTVGHSERWEACISTYEELIAASAGLAV